jgi:glycosyltransferase involved in cell wall biosynthesis
VGAGIPWYSQMKIYWPRAAALAKEMRRAGADVVHLTTPGPIGVAARHLAARRRLPMVGSFHTNLGDYASILSGSQALRGAMNAYMRWLYRPCRTVLAPSAATASALAAGGYRRERLGVWSRGVDTARFAPGRRSAMLRQEWGADDRRPVVLYAGRVSREKGLDLLPPVLTLLAGRGLTPTLVIAGDGPMLPELRQRLPRAVTLGEIGHARMGEVMASSDVMLFPSATDTFGNVVLEAQSAGLPVVVSDAGGPREAMLSGRTGLVCRAGDAAAFADALSILLVDAARRRRMAREARAFAETRDWKVALEPLFRAWREAPVAA